MYVFWFEDDTRENIGAIINSVRPSITIIREFRLIFIERSEITLFDISKDKCAYNAETEIGACI